MDQSRYEPISETSRAEVGAAIERDDPEELLRVVLSAALHAEDPAWAEELCLHLALHSHPNVRGNAVLGLGHLSRSHGRLDRARAEPVIRAALGDADAYVRGQAEAAADDVEHFLGWRLGRPDPLRDWFEGLPVPGAAFSLNDCVRIETGPHAGSLGAVVYLLGTEPEPRYVVELGETGEDVHLAQSVLRRVE